MRHTFKAAILAASSLFAPATAQEAEDVVVITATRTPTRAERLPARVEVIDRADFEERNLASLPEAIGSQAVQGGGFGQQSSVFLRGANSKHVLALLDGIRLNDASNPAGAYDFGQDALGLLERVEILRGPASAIYGSDAIGGVVNMIPRRGGDAAFEPFVEAATGSFETYRGLIGAAGNAGGWSYGISAATSVTSGFDQVPDRFATNTGDKDGAGVETFTGSVRREAGAFGWDVLVRHRESEAEYDTFSGGLFFDLRADDPDLENQAQQSVWRLGGDVDPADRLSLRLAGGEVTSQRKESDGGLQTFSADSDRSFADFIASYRADNGIFTGGFSFERNSIDTQPQFASPLSAVEDQSAAFVTAQYDFGGPITITGSVRVDDYEAFGTRTTYSIGAVAFLTRARVFGSYGTAFKAPSLSERYETSFFNIGNPDLDPEESQSWEIGADWNITDAARVGASYYQTRIDNMINYNFGALQNINIDEAEIDGVEAYVELSPAAWANLRVRYAWTDARDGVTGLRLVRRPEHAWEFETRLYPSTRLSLGLTWTFVGERTDVTYNSDGTFASSSGIEDAFSIGAINANFDLTESAEVFVRVDNVTDGEYEEPSAYAGAPRSAYVGVRATF